MASIILSTLNARYTHSSFGLRYLLANMDELRSETVLKEFTIHDLIPDVLSDLLALNPQIIGFGVYIWNVEALTKLVADLKRVRPEIVVVLGGPEVSYETEEQPIVQLADYVITGEGDHEFRNLCRTLLAGTKPNAKVLHAPVPELPTIHLPYDEYSDEDIQNRVIYVEASRGCPFTCEFCLSALEIPVRQFPLDEFLAQMQGLLDRGVRQFKFVDRTFNLNLRVSRAILEFFLERIGEGLFLHFELIPDRLPESLRALIARFPPGSIQFEIGIQTFDPEVCRLISRPQENELVESNLRWLRENTSVHLHTDLIAGLPGESIESFAAGFDRLYRLKPQEIQVGILKRLRGTPIIRHDAEWQMVYSHHPPYEILSTKMITFEQLQSIRRLARVWDLVGNSGNFLESLALMLDDQPSPFAAFQRFTDWLTETEGRRHGIALGTLFELVFHFMTRIQQRDADVCAKVLWADYTRGGRRDRPAFLRPYDLPAVSVRQKDAETAPMRQQRHLGKDNP